MPDNGTSGDDSSLVGDTNAGDLIYGFGGDDVITGRGGNDTLFGGAGADRLRGRSDEDILLGEAGRDTLIGGTGTDILNGGLGKDRLEGGRGKDTLSGGLGNDVLIGGGGEDILELATGQGTDRIQGFSLSQDLILLKDGLTFSDLTISNITESAGELILSSASILPAPLIRAILPSSSAIQVEEEFIGIVQRVPAEQLDAFSFLTEV